MTVIPEQIEAIIFDLDGTLFDSMGIWEQIDREFLAERQIEIPDDYFEAVMAMSFYEVAEYTIKRFRLPETVAELQLEWSRRAAKKYSQVEIKPYVIDYIKLVHEAGYELAVATSLPESLYRPALKYHKLLDYFSLITTTGEIGRGKDSPLIYQETAKRLGLRPDQCLLYEDILEAVLSARKVSMPVIAVHDLYSEKDWETMKQEADGWIRDFSKAPVPSVK